MSLRAVSFSQKIPQGPFIKLGLIRYFRRPVYLIFVGIIILLGLFLSIGESRDVMAALYPAGILLLVMPLLHLLGLRYLLNSNLILKNLHTVTANDQGILLEGKGFYTFYGWEVFSEAKTPNDWILLFVAKNSSIYIYLPSIEDLGDQEILKAMVKAELNSM